MENVVWSFCSVYCQGGSLSLVARKRWGTKRRIYLVYIESEGWKCV